MNNMKQTILGLFAALILMTASCSNDEKDEPTTYDPATEIAGTYLGETKVTNGTSSYSYPESTFIIRKESTGGVRYDSKQWKGTSDKYLYDCRVFSRQVRICSRSN